MKALAPWGATLAAAAALTLAGTAARGGAWPREEGTFFIAVGSNVALTEAARRPVHHDPTAYLEYGLTDRLTIGFDGYLADAGEAGSALVFLRHPLTFGSLGGPDSRSRLAATLGVGATLLPDERVEPTLRGSLSWGYGLDHGWLSAEADLVVVMGEGMQGKLAFTWGREVSETLTGILEMQVGTGLTGDVYAKVTPSVAWSVSDSLTIRIGATRALTGDRGTGLMVQTWWEF